MTRTVLLVAFTYPPAPGAGGVRARGLVRHLPACGWRVIVVTPRLDDTDRGDADVVETGYRDVIANLKSRIGLRSTSVGALVGIDGRRHDARGARLRTWIHRAAFSAVSFPDEHRGWTKEAVQVATKVGREAAVSAVMSTSPPITDHIVANRTASALQVPWLADFRDLWSGNPYDTSPSWRAVLDRRLEQRVIGNSARISTISPPWADHLIRLHRREVTVIPNGWEPDEVREGIAPGRLPLKIVHTGTLYAGKRDPGPLLRAIRRAIDRGAFAPNDILVEFLGPPEAWLRDDIEHLKLGAYVVQRGRVTREAAIDAQREADLLLLLTWNDPAEAGTCPAKLFEYLAAQRPIILIGKTDCEAGNVLREVRGGDAFGPDQVEEIVAYLCSHRDRVAAGLAGRPDYDAAALASHSQPSMARRFADVLDSMVAARH